MAQKINDAGLEIIKEFERGPSGDFAAYRYKDPVGYWTIGWGHLIKSGETFDEPLSRQEAENLLKKDIAEFEDCVNRTVDEDISSNEFSALVSFAFNLGCGALQKSTLLKKLESGDHSGAAAEFDRWVYAGGKKLNGLIRRRKMERQLFETPDPEPEVEPDVPPPSPDPDVEPKPIPDEDDQIEEPEPDDQEEEVDKRRKKGLIGHLLDFIRRLLTSKK